MQLLLGCTCRCQSCVRLQLCLPLDFSRLSGSKLSLLLQAFSGSVDGLVCCLNQSGGVAAICLWRATLAKDNTSATTSSSSTGVAIASVSESTPSSRCAVDGRAGGLTVGAMDGRGGGGDCDGPAFCPRRNPGTGGGAGGGGGSGLGGGTSLGGGHQFRSLRCGRRRRLVGAGCECWRHPTWRRIRRLHSCSRSKLRRRTNWLHWVRNGNGGGNGSPGQVASVPAEEMLERLVPPAATQ